MSHRLRVRLGEWLSSQSNSSSVEMAVKLLAEAVVNQLQAWLWLGNLLPCSISDSQESVSCWLETYFSRYLVISIGYLRKKKNREGKRTQNGGLMPQAFCIVITAVTYYHVYDILFIWKESLSPAHTYMEGNCAIPFEDRVSNHLWTDCQTTT